MNKFGITLREFKAVKKRFEKHEVINFQFVVQYAKDKDYDMTTDWGNIKKEKYPRLTFIQSPTMKSNFRKYGDTVFFEVFYKIIKSHTDDMIRYKVAFFFVQDTNGRILIGAVAIFCEENEASIRTIFS